MKTFDELLMVESSGVLMKALCDQVSSAATDGGYFCAGRTIAFIGGIVRPLVFLRDKDGLKLTSEVFLEYLDLDKIQKLCNSAKQGSILSLLCGTLKLYLDDLKNERDPDGMHQVIARELARIVNMTGEADVLASPSNDYSTTPGM